MAEAALAKAHPPLLQEVPRNAGLLYCTRGAVVPLGSLTRGCLPLTLGDLFGVGLDGDTSAMLKTPTSRSPSMTKRRLTLWAAMVSTAESSEWLAPMVSGLPNPTSAALVWFGSLPRARPPS